MCITGLSPDSTALIQEAHRVFILCAEGHLEDKEERENKEESPAPDGRGRELRVVMS
jgi:hypothetical protein